MEVQKNGSEATCTCGCGCGWASGHRVFRILLGLIIAIVVFWIGVKVGEFRMILDGRFGGGFGGGYGYPVQYYQRSGMPMMRQVTARSGAQPAPTGTTPSGY